MFTFKRYYIPNALTVLRLLAVPVLVYLFLDDRILAACVVFTLAAFTDLLDGLLARALNAESDIGALLDPLADKSLVLIGYIVLAVWDLIPSELVFLVIVRDLVIVTAYFSFPTAHDSGRITPSRLSKLNTVFQVILLFVAFWSLGLPKLGFDVNLTGPVTLLVWAVAVTTVTSGIGYGLIWRRRYQSRNPKA